MKDDAAVNMKGDMKVDMHRNRLMKRLMRTKMNIISRNPFYGSLVWHLEFVLKECGTAATDARKIYFDPDFVNRTNDEELMFTALHEILHCALGHCFRGAAKNEKIFNLACDTVVNSFALVSFRKESFVIDGHEVPHLAPDGREGYLCSAEEVYDMMAAKSGMRTNCWSDSHECWNLSAIEKDLPNEWRQNVKKAAAAVGEDDFYMSQICKNGYFREEKPQIDWKEILSDFLFGKIGSSDYSFAPPDRRFSDFEIIMPAFGNCEKNDIENVWFLVDTSGSVKLSEIMGALAEIKALLNRFDSVEAYVSFFDTRVSDPVSINCAEDLEKIVPMGRGGTSFFCIFRYLHEHMDKFAPKIMIILTDGCAEFPDEAEAMGIPVVWVIRDGSNYSVKIYND